MSEHDNMDWLFRRHKLQDARLSITNARAVLPYVLAWCAFMGIAVPVYFHSGNIAAKVIYAQGTLVAVLGAFITRYSGNPEHVLATAAIVYANAITTMCTSVIYLGYEQVGAVCALLLLPGLAAPFVKVKALAALGMCSAWSLFASLILHDVVHIADGTSAVPVYVGGLQYCLLLVVFLVRLTKLAEGESLPLVRMGTCSVDTPTAAHEEREGRRSRDEEDSVVVSAVEEAQSTLVSSGSLSTHETPRRQMRPEMAYLPQLQMSYPTTAPPAPPDVPSHFFSAASTFQTQSTLTSGEGMMEGSFLGKSGISTQSGEWTVDMPGRTVSRPVSPNSIPPSNISPAPMLNLSPPSPDPTHRPAALLPASSKERRSGVHYLDEVKAPSSTLTIPQGAHPIGGSPKAGGSLACPAQKGTSYRVRAESRHETTTPSDVKTITRTLRWRKGELLGQGGFGKVHRGLNLETGQFMAVKSVEFDVKDKAVATKMAQLANEIKVISQLNHLHVVRYFFTEKSGLTVNIFMEFVSAGSVANLLKIFGPLEEDTVVNYTYQILVGLAGVHMCGVTHRDIKGANLLITATGIIKLADFGSSGLSEEGADGKFEGIHGTPYWMAPEVLRAQRYSFQADIWSVGCTVMEMLTAQNPWHHFTANTQLQVLHWVCDDTQPVTAPPGLTAASEAFLLDCLNRNPMERPSAQELIDHHYFCSDAEELSRQYRREGDSDTESETASTHSSALHRPHIRRNSVASFVGSTTSSVMHSPKFAFGRSSMRMASPRLGSECAASPKLIGGGAGGGGGGGGGRTTNCAQSVCSYQSVSTQRSGIMSYLQSQKPQQGGGGAGGKDPRGKRTPSFRAGGSLSVSGHSNFPEKLPESRRHKPPRMPRSPQPQGDEVLELPPSQGVEMEALQHEIEEEDDGETVCSIVDLPMPMP